MRIGKASKGLETRYRGGTGYALDAAMDDSENLVFVAPVPAHLVTRVENELIYLFKPPYNNVGKTNPPGEPILIEHVGEFPREENSLKSRLGAK